MKREASALAPKSALPMPDRDHIQGPIDAPIALVEYGDYECPYCGEAYPIVKAIQERLGDRLCFAFRNFPLVNSHPHAEHVAEAAEAAGTQGRFWEMHDLLYRAYCSCAGGFSQRSAPGRQRNAFIFHQWCAL